ncbi:MAG: flagellar assembly peptidoglycan hydrolase FlgJ [Thiobacillaceae bacterium]
MLASAGIADRLAADSQGLQGLKLRAGAGDPGAMREAARQFEALLLQTLLKEMRETSWRAADDPFDQSESLKLYRELLDQQWVQRMVQGKGLGFAEKMAEQMRKGQGSNEAASTAPPPAAGRITPQREVEPTADAGAAERVEQATLASAGTGAAGLGATDPATRKAGFLQTMRPHAEAAAQTTGLPADFILAHAALESGWGVREIHAQDGRPSHNLFGIKADSRWTGASVERETTEYHHGLPVRLNARFRAYDNYTQAFGDYANLLMHRYGNAIRAGRDADAFARALVDGGYATDPAYAGKLKAVIASVARMNA